MEGIFASHAVHVDGSQGEGGGQILRTSLALSCVLGKPVEVINIRKTRKKPGLQPQHLTAVKAAAMICRAHVEGAELSSTSLLFSPGDVVSGDYSFDVSEKQGSAGSVSLVLQTIFLPLCFAASPSTVMVIGGTHVPWSPSFHYLKQVFAPALSRIDVTIDLEIEQWGWYPLGGGRVIARVIPKNGLASLMIPGRGKFVQASGISAVSNLPRNIAVRQRDAALKALARRGFDAEIEIISAPSRGKGTSVFLLVRSENITAGFDALGAIGKRAEEVADEACGALFEYMDADAALDPHLADQIIPYLAFGREKSEFTTSRITKHLLTNIWVVKKFIDADIGVEGREGGAGRVWCIPQRAAQHRH